VRINSSTEALSNLKAQLAQIQAQTKDLKSMSYYEDQMSFHTSEKRLKTSSEVIFNTLTFRNSSLMTLGRFLKPTIKLSRIT